MNHIRYALVGAALFFISSIPVTVLASVSSSPSGTTVPQASLTVYCYPYTSPFSAGNYYAPADNGGCTYGLPALIGTQRLLGIYKGVIGSATLQSYDTYDASTIPQTNVDTQPASFGGTQGDNFFIAVVGGNTFNDILNADTYLRTGAGSIPQSYAILPFIYGTDPTPVTPPGDTVAPTVTIISPAAGKKYARGDSVLIVATIADASAIANVRYLFNGQQVDPAVPLQLGKAPLGPNTVSVIATDSFGNVGSSTVTFRVMPGGNTCIADATETSDHKWIANKNVFKDTFEDCQKITGRGHDGDEDEDSKPSR